MRLAARDIPARLSTGAYILHAGWGKWHGSEEQAQRVHATAAAAFPFLAKVPPATFLKPLAAAEIATGAALLMPAVPNKLAGAALTSGARPAAGPGAAAGRPFGSEYASPSARWLAAFSSRRRVTTRSSSVTAQARA